MTVRLRAHHLLCLLTYVGKGYSPAFTANYDLIVERIGAGEGIEVVVGPDDICAPLLAESEPHCRRESVIERDRLAASAVSNLLAKPVAPGALLDIGEDWTRRMRMEFSDGNARGACKGCEWYSLCTKIAGDGFRGAKLYRPG